MSFADYYSKFPIVKRPDSLTVDDLVKASKIIFAEFGLIKKIISGTGKFHIRIILAILQTDEHTADHNIILSPAEQWLGGGVYEIHEMSSQKCLDTNNDVNLTLLQIRSKPKGVGLPSPSMLLFNRPITCLLPGNK